MHLRPLVLLAACLIAAPVLAETKLEVFATLTEPPGNIAVLPDGRVIVSVHQMYGRDLRVVEVAPGGAVTPFPSAAWNEIPGEGDTVGLNSVLGVRADRDGIVWMLDNAVATGAVPRIVGWDTVANALAHVIPVREPATSPKPYLNDLAVDRDHGKIFIADPTRDKRPALIVVDIETGAARRLLENHASTVPEDVPLIIKGRGLRIRMADGSMLDPRIGVNPIAIDSANEWLYYGPMSGTSLYRVAVADLLDESLSDTALGDRVERYGPKPPSGGITVDDAGNVYVTDIGASGIGVIRPDGTYELLVSDEELLDWPDGFATGPDGYVYLAVNRLHKSAKLNGGVNESAPPYYVVRFKPLTPVTVGR